MYLILVLNTELVFNILCAVVIADELQLRQAVYSGNVDLGQFAFSDFLVI